MDISYEVIAKAQTIMLNGIFSRFSCANINSPDEYNKYGDKIDNLCYRLINSKLN